MSHHLTPGTFTGFDSMKPGELNFGGRTNSPSPRGGSTGGINWTRFSKTCIDKVARRLIDHYDKSRSGELSSNNIENLLKDVYSGSKIMPAIEPADIQDFKNFHDKDMNGR